MTGSLEELRKLNRGYIFGFLIFMDLFFGSGFAWHLFFWVSRKMSGPSPPVIHMSEHTPWCCNHIDFCTVSVLSL